MRRWLLVSCLLLALAPDPAQASAVTFQANALRDGNAGRAGITPPLRRAWTARFDGTPSYAVIAGGRVFVIVSSRTFSAPDPQQLVALSARSGRVLWRQDLGSNYDAGLAYDAGRVFVSRSTVLDPGGLIAFDAATGALAWSTDIGSSSGDPPVADGGMLYTRIGIHGGWVTARRQSDGTEVWQRNLDNGTDGAFAVTADAVYAALPAGTPSGCGARTARWSGRRRTNARVVAVPSRSSGPAASGARRVRLGGHGQAYDLATGSRREHWRTEWPAAFAGDLGLFPDARREGEALPFGHVLIARDVPSGRVRWRFTGDGYLDTSPLIAGRTAYVGSGSGRVYGVSLRSGRRVWRASIGVPVHGPAGGQSLGGLAAADGLLVVPGWDRVVAFRT